MERILITIYLILYVLIYTMLFPISIILTYLAHLEYVIIRTFEPSYYNYVISKYSNFVEKLLICFQDFYTFIVFRKEVFKKWDYEYALLSLKDNVKYYYNEFFGKQAERIEE